MEINSSERSKVVRKAFEIAYAFFRIAQVASSRAYGDSLEVLGVRFIQGVVREDRQKTLAACEEGDQILNLGLGCDLVGIQNGATVLAMMEEIKNSAVNFSSSAREADILPVNNFNGQGTLNWGEAGMGSRQAQAEEASDQTQEETQVIISNEETPDASRDETKEPIFREPEVVFQSVSGEAKQLAILNHIRKSGEIRMRDLQNLFPDVNERLLRYHLQKLGQKGLVQQVGSAAATYYKPAYPDTFSGYKLPDNHLAES